MILTVGGRTTWFRPLDRPDFNDAMRAFLRRLSGECTPRSERRLDGWVAVLDCGEMQLQDPDDDTETYDGLLEFATEFLAPGSACGLFWIAQEELRHLDGGARIVVKGLGDDVHVIEHASAHNWYRYQAMFLKESIGIVMEMSP